MEARILRPALVAAALVALLGANYRTPNFTIETADPRLAEAFGKTAERCRHDLAVEWVGQAMPNWSQPCLMTVQVGPHLGAGGATSFMFNHGEVYGWRMTIQGSAERVIDSVLPHEITHMIFASYFRQPLPRWADEGGATSVEHASERAKHQRMLLQFLRSGRGIAFNQMFAMTEYPADIMPLYAQGYSLAEYLIEQGGRKRYVTFLAEALKDDQWAAAIRRNYGFSDLSALQNAWVAWVAQGSPQLQPRVNQPAPAGPSALAAATRPEPNLIYRISSPARQPLTADGNDSLPSPQWSGNSASSGEIRTQVTHPQPIQQPRQVILEWSRP